MHPLIENHCKRLRALASGQWLRRLRLFGSMALGDADADSDADLLGSMPPGVTGLALGALLMDAQVLLHRKVQVVTEQGLHPALREQILREARML